MSKFNLVLNIIFLILFIGVGFYILKSVSDYQNFSVMQFDKVMNIKVGQKVTFVDGLNIKLKEIDDSRCNPGIDCVHQGELYAVFKLTDINDLSLGQFQIGNLYDPTAKTNGYVFLLKNIKKDTASIMVSK